jgi:hypothetical protein
MKLSSVSSPEFELLPLTSSLVNVFKPARNASCSAKSTCTPSHVNTYRPSTFGIEFERREKEHAILESNVAPPGPWSPYDTSTPRPLPRAPRSGARAATHATCAAAPRPFFYSPRSRTGRHARAAPATRRRAGRRSTFPIWTDARAPRCPCSRPRGRGRGGASAAATGAVARPHAPARAHVPGRGRAGDPAAGVLASVCLSPSTWTGFQCV